MEKKDLASLSYYPLNFPETEQFASKQFSTFWVPEEISFADDPNDWNCKVDDNTKSFVKKILFLFAQLDGIVNENLMHNFQQETSFCKEVGFFYAAQAAIEVIHNKTYSIMIHALIQDHKEREIGLNSIKNFPEIRAIAEWAYSMMSPDIPLLERIIGFCCIEGIIFSSAFAGIYYIKRKNILRGLTKANEWIARDEALHTMFGVHIYHLFTKVLDRYPRVSSERVREIITSAVQVNEQFTREALNVNLIGLDFNDMMSYVYCTADTLAKNLEYDTIYNVENKLDWMAIISLSNKTNFFESKVSEYAKQTEFDTEYDPNVPC